MASESREESCSDPDFVDLEASKKFACSVCLSLAVQPRLNPSCGHHFCHPCTEKLVDNGQPCPECRATITHPVPDLNFERKIKQLKVRCALSKNGCQWVGQLAELQGHLDRCPIQPIECDFSYAGCPAKRPRRELDQHMQESLAVHVGLLCKQVQQRDEDIMTLREEAQALKKEMKLADSKVQKLEKQLQSVSAVVIPEFVMTDFQALRDADQSWYSPPFYSHIGGYKMCLRVHAYGRQQCAGTHVSVFVHHMPGENDDHLKWPFRGDITVRLVNHRAKEGYVEDTIPFNDETEDIYCSRVIGLQCRHMGLGIPSFVAHSALTYNTAMNTEFLKDDSLTFQVVST